jgi:hypothetical protein
VLVIDQSEYIEDRPVPGPFPAFQMTKREKPWERGCIKHSFKNSSVKATIKQLRSNACINSLSDFFEFLFFYALWQKINQTNSILKGLYQNL